MTAPLYCSTCQQPLQLAGRTARQTLAGMTIKLYWRCAVCSKVETQFIREKIAKRDRERAG